MQPDRTAPKDTPRYAIQQSTGAQTAVTDEATNRHPEEDRKRRRAPEGDGHTTGHQLRAEYETGADTPISWYQPRPSYPKRKGMRDEKQVRSDV